MFTGEKSGSGFGLINPASSPYSEKNPQNPYRPYRGLGSLGAQTVLNPLPIHQDSMRFPTRVGQLAGVPATGFSGFGDVLSDTLTGIKTFLVGPLGLLLAAGGLMVLGYHQGWWGEKKD